jgi:protein-disulfide isomerase
MPTIDDADPAAEAGHDVKSNDDEYIYIPKALVYSVITGVVMLLVGGAAGYFLATNTFQRGAANAPQAAAVNVDQPAAAPQPTAPPAVLENVSADDDPYLGSADAPVTIVEFSDFRCPYCKRWHDETLPQILDAYGDQVKIVYRDFPVVGGETAAEASECANAQGGYWDYHYGLFENPQAYSSVDDFVSLADEQGLDADTFRACLENNDYQDEIVGDYNDARDYGVTGTPTFFINGVRIVGAQPFANFQSVIDEQLNQ